jgi:hypothetical protein
MRPDADRGRAALGVGARSDNAGVAEVIIRTYAGDNQMHAARLYAEDAPDLSAEGWVPVTQIWVADEWPFSAFVIATILIVVGIRIIMLAVMAVIKPTRTLLVTYQRGVASVA